LAGIEVATTVGLGRGRAFDPTQLLVIASYYVLLAVIGAQRHTVVIRAMVAGIFVSVAVIGYKTNLWIVVFALVAHATFDFVHHLFIGKLGVPHWWLSYCLAFDMLMSGFLAVSLIRRSNFSLKAEDIVDPPSKVH
jgi:hypothetical protein